MPDPTDSYHKCPFYGFHWPERGTSLLWSGAAECGLDLEHHGMCRMEREHTEVDFHQCPVRLNSQNLLEAGKHHIRFYSAELPPEGLPFAIWSDIVLSRE
jgi:hypothetical protein